MHPREHSCLVGWFGQQDATERAVNWESGVPGASTTSLPLFLLELGPRNMYFVRTSDCS